MGTILRTGTGLGALALAATLVACGTSTPTSVPVNRSTATTWHLRLAGSSAGSVLLDIGGAAATPRVLHPDAMYSQVLGGASSRVLLIGDLTVGDLLEVRGSAPGVEPTVTVRSAAASGSSGFQQIAPGDLTWEWQPVP